VGMVDQHRPTQRAIKLRNEATKAERLLWRSINARQLDGHNFSRQIPIGPYICDFVCRWEKLVIELDGRFHDEIVEQDEYRQRQIEAQGYKVLRFSNAELFSNLDGVLTVIRQALPSLPTPSPSLKGGG
jgi:very-short-patch-repair endonuclease